MEDYQRLVDDLIARFPIDRAMSIAVGGSFDLFGPIEAQLLADLGLKSGMTLIDLGCGSGRGAVAFAKRFEIAYLGTDIVQALLDYAASRTPPHYQFRLHRQLSVPAPDSCADMICAFSLFTHLLQPETYLYMKDSARALKPNGQLVFSYLDVWQHWNVFEDTVNEHRTNSVVHLNTFMDRTLIEHWASHIGLAVDQYISPSKPILNGHSFGQAVCVLRKRA